MREPTELAIGEAIAFLRGHLSGLLRFDAETRPLKIVVAPDGKLIASAMVAMIRAIDTVFAAPDDNDESMHLQVTMESFDENGPLGALADRWRIYHGDPPDVRWARMSIDGCRFNGLFIDGDAMMAPNPLAGQQAAICKALNAAHTDLIRAACLARAQLGIEKPVVVGVDDLGFDVRGAFDVVRLDSARPLQNEADAIAELQALAGAR